MMSPRLCLFVGLVFVAGCSRGPVGGYTSVELTPEQDTTAVEQELSGLMAADGQLARYRDASADDRRWRVLRAKSAERFFVIWRTVVDRHNEADSILIAGSDDHLFTVDVGVPSIDSVRLLRSARADTYLLVVDSYGPTHAASASSGLLVYELDPKRRRAQELLVIGGPEEYLAARTFRYSVAVEDGPVIEAAVAVDGSLDPKQGVWIERAARGRVTVLKESIPLVRVRIAGL